MWNLIDVKFYGFKHLGMSILGLKQFFYFISCGQFIVWAKSVISFTLAN